MAAYGSNSVAVRFQDNPEPVPANKTQEMPAHRPNVGTFMPGGKEGKSGKAKGMKTLRNPWKRQYKSKKVVNSLMGY